MTKKTIEYNKYKLPMTINYKIVHRKINKELCKMKVTK